MVWDRGSLLSWERGLKFVKRINLITSCRVAPLVGAWIEIDTKPTAVTNESVAPLVGAWIEMYPNSIKMARGIVAPLVGAWIEIKYSSMNFNTVFVAPLVGAWIEMYHIAPPGFRGRGSLLSWERGLKYGKSVEKLFVYEGRSSRGSVD